jgi:hypothetical protein
MPLVLGAAPGSGGGPGACRGVGGGAGRRRGGAVGEGVARGRVRAAARPHGRPRGRASHRRLPRASGRLLLACRPRAPRPHRRRPPTTAPTRGVVGGRHALALRLGARPRRGAAPGRRRGARGGAAGGRRARQRPGRRALRQRLHAAGGEGTGGRGAGAGRGRGWGARMGGMRSRSRWAARLQCAWSEWRPGRGARSFRPLGLGPRRAPGGGASRACRASHTGQAPFPLPLRPRLPAHDPVPAQPDRKAAATRGSGRAASDLGP